MRNSLLVSIAVTTPATQVLNCQEDSIMMFHFLRLFLAARLAIVLVAGTCTAAEPAREPAGESVRPRITAKFY